MYDFKLNKNEKINLISDNTVIYTDTDKRNVTCIITNQRLLILDYPSGIHNSKEDLRISGKMTYIRKKEIICEIKLQNIISIIKKKDSHKIELNEGFINLKDDEIIKYLNKEKNNE